MNPLFKKWKEQKFFQWQRSELGDHWLLHWAPDVDASTVFFWTTYTIWALLGLYLACLLSANLCTAVWYLHGWICEDYTRQHKLPAIQDEQDAVRDLLEKSKEEFPSNIKPIVVLTWPWRGGGLLQSLALLLLDVGLDVNTIFTFLVDGRFWFAAVTTFLVIRSMLKQLSILPVWHLRKAG